MIDLFENYKEDLNSFEGYLKKQLQNQELSDWPAINTLFDSINYSAFSGGKRFRPLLSMLTAKALNHSIEKALPYAAAVECIHTYSLIHDDLPCMDNDEERRGLPTNHIKYGEDIALLAGDSLLSVAFEILMSSDQPDSLVLKALKNLSHSVGPYGMIGGQILDIKSDTDTNVKQLEKVHELKTGALIYSSVVGTAELLGATKTQLKNLASYSRGVGFCFQLADDIEDYYDNESTSFINATSFEQTAKLLKQETQKALSFIEAPEFENPKGLVELAEFNYQRVHSIIGKEIADFNY
ncbi:MAG: polyprenyl synthetase family protein [Bdellovibrionales bacterium]|nr:polyprenyl synthetase family protein [Bdellovibrionales bacterium]